MVIIRLESINSLKCTLFLFLHMCAKNFCTGVQKIFAHLCKKFFLQMQKKVFCTGIQKIKYFIFEFHINQSKSKYFNLAFNKN